MKRTREKESKPEIDFSILEPSFLKQVNEAVKLATKLDSDQPILFRMIAEDHIDNECHAYWPASEEIGSWLINTITVLGLTDTKKQVFMGDCFYYNPDSVEQRFKGLYNDKITKLSDLGVFKCVHSDIFKDDKHRPKYNDDVCGRSDLNTFLFSVDCMAYY